MTNSRCVAIRIALVLASILLLAACGGPPSSMPPPAPTTVAVAITPETAPLKTGATQQFTATVTRASNTAVIWTVQEMGGGTITAAGVYTAPATAGTYHLVATSAAAARLVGAVRRPHDCGHARPSKEQRRGV